MRITDEKGYSTGACATGEECKKIDDLYPKTPFTKEMKKTHTILIPSMLPIHFRLLDHIFKQSGYNTVVLKGEKQHCIDAGLKYVHNDTCYPALIVIGQLMEALLSGEYDLNKTAVMIIQTGGGCRASNYYFLLRKALINAGMQNVPVISVNLSGMNSNPGFKITLPMLRRAAAAIIYGDLMMQLSNQTRPYEVNKGQTEDVITECVQYISDIFDKGKGISVKEIRENLLYMAELFKVIPIERTQKVKAGVVGEVFVKYSPIANNNLEGFLAEQDCEVVVPGVTGFMLFKIDNRLEDIRLYGGNQAMYKGIMILFNYMTKVETILIDVCKGLEGFSAPSSYAHIKSLAAPVIGSGCKMGEGWWLTGEIIELIEQGCPNIVCTQPFGCLPNHIVAKGMIRKLRSLYPNSNVVAIDYDPGATKVNQENRIKLMLAMAKEQAEPAPAALRCP